MLEFARVVVAGARRDDAERYVGLREHLQRKRDDAVTADHHQRVHAALERAVNEPSRVLGVGARDRDDVDTASCNCATARSAACGALPCPDAGLVNR